VEVIKIPSIDGANVNTVEQTAPSWPKPIVEYIQGKIPKDGEAAKKIAR
jgi:hypothetical protein